jgi:Ssp1 endopeptidase immunity protein Rap1a
MHLSISMIMLMIGVATAVAQVQEATGPYRAEHLRDACQTLTQNATNTPSGRAAAEGTCAGAISTVVRLGPMMNDQFRFCPPQQATPKQVMPILLEFLDKNPAALKLDIRDVMNYVGRLTWPCK